MHYYKRNLGDYAKKAGRLSMLQHGSYTLLIDACYDREQFPTLDEAIEWTWASTTEEVEAVAFVLRKFFELKDGFYVQKRIKEEIAEYHAKSQTNKRIAIDRETVRAAKRTNRTQGVDAASESGDESPPNHEPGTINQEPSNSVPKGTAAITAKSPADLTKEELWSSGKSLLAQQGLPPAQCGSFIGKLVKDYGGEVVVEAVRAAVVERPANAQEFLVGACRSRDQKNPVKRTSSFLNLLPANSPRIPMADDPDNLPAWMRDDVELIHV